LKKLSEKTYKNEDSRSRTFAEELELEHLLATEPRPIEVDGEGRVGELKKKSSFYDCEDNELREFEDIDGSEE